MAVLGLQGTGRWDSPNQERPTNFREKIFYLWPNSPAILTAISGKLKSEAVNDPKFTIFEKGLPSMRAMVEAGQSDAGYESTINLDNDGDGTFFRSGQTIINERTREVMWVTSVDAASSPNVVTVGTRGEYGNFQGSGNATARKVNDADYLLITGNHNAEGGDTPGNISFNPTTRYNYTQIWRTPLRLTGTAKETYLRTGDVEKELKREGAERHAIEMEWSAIMGVPFQGSTGGQYDRTTGGFLHYAYDSGNGNVLDFAGSVTKDAWEGFLEDVFAVPASGSEKLCLCGNRALTTLNQMAQAYGQIELTPTSESYGMKLSRYETPYGTLQLKGHPLLSQNPGFADWGMIVDTKNFLYRPLKNRDTKFLMDRQGNGEDAITHEFFTEGGWEFRHAATHGYFMNAAAFTP